MKMVSGDASIPTLQKSAYIVGDVLTSLCFASSIVTQKWCDLALEEIQTEPVDRELLAILVHLPQTFDRHAKREAARLLFKVSVG